MKRLFCLFLVVILCVLSGCGQKKDALILIDELNEEYEAGELHSYLVDYRVEDDKVVFTCNLYIENTTQENKELEIFGFYEEDVESGFILDKDMKAVDIETKSDSFTIQPLEKKMFEVEFTAQKGNGADIKADRLLPEITILEKA